MNSLNKVTLIGNLGRDPEVRTTQAGSPVVTFSLATGQAWKDKTTGERKESTDWHNIVVFNEGLGRIVEQYCRKGSKIYVEGQLQTREYTDRDGVTRRTTEVVLQKYRGEIILLGKNERTAPAPDSYGKTTSRPPGTPDDPRTQQAPPQTSRMIDDDIPF